MPQHYYIRTGAHRQRRGTEDHAADEVEIDGRFSENVI